MSALRRDGWLWWPPGRSLVAAILAFALSACASAPYPEWDLTTLSVPEETAGAEPLELYDQYRIQPGDSLDIFFQFKASTLQENFRIALDHTVTVKFVHAPELSETQPVRPDGQISLPYVGEYAIVGKTVREARDELTRRYASILQDPELYVVVPEFRSAIDDLKRDLHTSGGLRRVVHVRLDGYVTFPMIGEMRVARRTISDVNNEMNAAYAKQFRSLHVDLFLEKHAGAVLYVIGEVRNPGAYQITRPLTPVQALALAGGFTPSASLENVLVARRTGEELVARRLYLDQSVFLGGNKAPIYLQPDDVIFVPRSRLATAAQIARELQELILFRGWQLTIRVD